MQIQITGRHLPITEAIRNYILSKFERMTRHIDQISSVHFILGKDGIQFSIEVKIHLPGHDLFVENRDEEMYAAIDILMDKLDRQLLKVKSKLKDHNHAPHHQMDERVSLEKEDEEDLD